MTNKLMISIVALTVAASSASAFGGDRTYNTNTNANANHNTNANLNHNSATALAAQNQNQAQQQGQAQGQGQLQGQNQAANANNRNSINMEGSVGIAVGSAACTSGFSVGAPGAGAIGFSVSNKDCKIVQEAQVLWNMGMHDAARTHMTRIARIAQSVAQNQPVISASPVMATRTAAPAPAAPLYSSCEVIGNTPHITVPAAFVEDADYVQRAAVACWETR